MGIGSLMNSLDLSSVERETQLLWRMRSGWLCACLQLWPKQQWLDLIDLSSTCVGGYTAHTGTTHHACSGGHGGGVERLSRRSWESGGGAPDDTIPLFFHTSAHFY